MKRWGWKWIALRTKLKDRVGRPAAKFYDSWDSGASLSLWEGGGDRGDYKMYLQEVFRLVCCLGKTGERNVQG
jgi:hypothetical protein